MQSPTTVATSAGRRATRRLLLLPLLLLLSASGAQAACSRPLLVPVAPTGYNVRLQGELIDGVYPDLLRAIGRRAGCEFSFPVYPRARLTQMFFELHQADMFIPGSRTAEREQKAEFVPMLKLTPSLITLRTQPDTVTDLRGLLARSDWRAAMVRSYTWGDGYEALLRELEAQKRVDYVNDLRTVGLMLRSGRVQFTVLPPTLLYSALQEALPGDAAADLRFRPIDGLPRSEVGAYLSPHTLAPADLKLLREQLRLAARDGLLRRSLEAYYPAEILRHDVVID